MTIPESRLKIGKDENSLVEVGIQDGKDLVKLEGIEYSYEPVWSDSTGRSADGTMQGSIKAHKRTFTISFVPLTLTQLTNIVNAISARAFFSMSLYDGLETYNATVYAAPHKCKAYGGLLGLYTDFQIELIER